MGRGTEEGIVDLMSAACSPCGDWDDAPADGVS